MNKILSIGLMTILMVTIYGCQIMNNDLVNPNNTERQYNDTTYVGQFQRVWQGIDVGYVFWQWEKVNWDAVYDTNLPVFEAADQHHKETGETGMSFDDYQATWNKIITPLMDHHMMVVLYRPDDPQMELAVASPADRRRSKADSHRSFTKDEHLACLQSLLDKGEISGYYQVDSTKDVSNQMLYFIDGMFNINGVDSVAYFYISSFNTPQPTAASADSACATCVFRWLGRVIHQPNVAAILDTRNNSGGYSSWQQFLGQFFTTQAFYPNMSYYKAGFDRFYYTPAQKNWIYPNAGGDMRQMSAQYPFICLFDQHSVSNGEEIPWMFSYLPGYMSIGEQTCGGMGTLMPDNYTSYYSGTFGNAQLMQTNYKSTDGNYYCYMSTMANVDAKTGENPEGIGMIPIIQCPLDTILFFSGQGDNQLLRAMNYLKNER